MLEDTQPTVVSRRGFLVAGAGLAASTLLAGPALGAAAAATRPPAWLDEVWQWQDELAARGPRFTGNRAHRTYINFLDEELSRLGLHVFRDHYRFTRWDAQRWRLNTDRELPTTFYFPYSGRTGPAGVTGPIVDCGPAPGSFTQARGAIALVECQAPTQDPSSLFSSLGLYPASATPARPVPSVAAQGLTQPVDLAAAREAGALGVVCIWRGISDAQAANQYNPFTTPYAGIPAVWVGDSTGLQLQALAQQKASATLTLEATLQHNAPSDTVWAVLPGSGDARETIVVNTHTDGPNVPEENGGLGLLVLARQLARIPQHKRKRSYIFLFVTGHMRLPDFAVGGDPFNQATSRWLLDHAHQLDGRAGHRKLVAAVTLEHLGCREWLDDAHGRYRPTGRNELGFTYTTSHAMRDLYLNSARGTTNTRSEADRPAVSVLVGEGAPFFKAGIPMISLIPQPSYLLAADRDGAISKLSRRLLQGQVQTFSRALAVLDRTSTARLGPVLPPAG